MMPPKFKHTRWGRRKAYLVAAAHAAAVLLALIGAAHWEEHGDDGPALEFQRLHELASELDDRIDYELTEMSQQESIGPIPTTTGDSGD